MRTLFCKYTRPSSGKSGAIFILYNGGCQITFLPILVLSHFSDLDLLKQLSLVSLNTSDFVLFADIDECSTAVHSCVSLATCYNTEGGYNCTCKTGYNGDGKTSCVGERGTCLWYIEEQLVSYGLLTFKVARDSCDVTHSLIQASIHTSHVHGSKSCTTYSLHFVQSTSRHTNVRMVYAVKCSLYIVGLFSVQFSSVQKCLFIVG